MMMKPLSQSKLNLDFFFDDYKNRLTSLLRMDLNKIDTHTALDIVDANVTSKTSEMKGFVKTDFSHFLSSFDLERLIAYSDNKIDHFVIKDLIPVLAGLFF